MVSSLHSSTSRRWCRPTLGRAIVTVGVTLGLVGMVYGGPQRLWGHGLPGVKPAIAQAQTTVTDAEVAQYAQAVLQMDAYRSAAYGEITDLLSAANVDPATVTLGCVAQDLPGVPRRVRRQVEDILVTYCNQARDIVEQAGLSAERFNEITAAHRENAELTARIQAELAELQAE
jgi:hypothetical protein